MSKSNADKRRPRCECCEDVLEELMTMRQTFEKLCQRLTSQIAQLRRDVYPLTNDETNHNLKRFSQDLNIIEIPFAKSVKLDNNETTEEENYEVEFQDNFEEHVEEDQVIEEEEKPKLFQRLPGSVSISSISIENALKEQKVFSAQKIIPKRKIKIPAFKFFSIQTHVLPGSPFSDRNEFEDWDALLSQDQDQRDRLRIELLRGNFYDSDKYVKHMWKTVLCDEVATLYSYKGNIKTHKKAIKDFTFTACLKECFLERFEQCDEMFFIEHCKRYFNYASDRLRKRLSQSVVFENINCDGQNAEASAAK